MENVLQSGIDAYKSKNKILAAQIFNSIIQSEPKNEQAWLWLVACQETRGEKMECLHRAIINMPENENFKSVLVKLESQDSKIERNQKHEQVKSSDPIEVLKNIFLNILIAVGGLGITYFLIRFVFSGILGFLTGCIGLILIIIVAAISIRLALGYWASRIMEEKGRSGGIGYVMGIFLGIWGVIIAACLSVDENAIALKKLETGENKICPACRKAIDRKAIICPYCQTRQ